MGTTSFRWNLQGRRRPTLDFKSHSGGGRFAYSPQKSLTQMVPPPHVPVLADIPLEVADAFQRAFGSPASRSPIRPTAVEWVALLERMEKVIIECTANPAHYFSKNAPECPWCRFESGTGTLLFVAQYTASQSSFDLTAVLAKIETRRGTWLSARPDLPYVSYGTTKAEPSGTGL